MRITRTANFYIFFRNRHENSVEVASAVAPQYYGIAGELRDFSSFQIYPITYRLYPKEILERLRHALCHTQFFTLTRQKCLKLIVGFSEIEIFMRFTQHTSWKLWALYEDLRDTSDNL